MIVNICGMPYKVVEVNDPFGGDTVGQIDNRHCEIQICKEMSAEAKKETLFHEMVHGMLAHLGYDTEGNNETFVQGLANAIYQGFEIKDTEQAQSGLLQDYMKERKHGSD